MISPTDQRLVAQRSDIILAARNIGTSANHDMPNSAPVDGGSDGGEAVNGEIGRDWQKKYVATSVRERAPDTAEKLRADGWCSFRSKPTPLHSDGYWL